MFPPLQIERYAKTIQSAGIEATGFPAIRPRRARTVVPKSPSSTISTLRHRNSSALTAAPQGISSLTLSPHFFLILWQKDLHTIWH